MSTTRILLFLLCFGLTGSIGMFDSHLLAKDRRNSSATIGPGFSRERSGLFEKHLAADQTAICRQRLVQVALRELGVKEKTNKNDGERIEEYLAAVKLKRGNPYCAAFISWVFMQEGFAKPRSGWSPDLVPLSRITSSALPANIAGFYFPELSRVAHVAMIEKVHHHWAVTIEANTNLAGGREGEGVYRKRRHLKTIYRMADWIAPEGRKQQ